MEENYNILKRIGTFLGKNINTPDGKGTLIGVETPANGLYIEPKRCTLHVYFGINNN